ncbi:MAG: hypothetical protein GXX78_09305 [Bacteroidales bacterium]|jgi:hypothetical protein|nr:hypothetical protein [Bacteroidales bacterium]
MTNSIKSTQLIKLRFSFLKKCVVLFTLITIGLNALPQKNEIVILSGITTEQFFIDQSSVFQIKYERDILKSIGIQTGMRYHSMIEQNSWDNISKWVQSAYNSYKIDLSFMASPIATERFKLKVGVGFDIGFSNYYWAGRGVTLEQEDFDENNKLFYRDFTYWRYDIDKIVDTGVHFIFNGNYYFKNNLFVTAQILYNYVFDEEVASQKYSQTLYRESPLCLSAGLGFKF